MCALWADGVVDQPALEFADAHLKARREGLFVIAAEKDQPLGGYQRQTLADGGIGQLLGAFARDVDLDIIDVKGGHVDVRRHVRRHGIECHLETFFLEGVNGAECAREILQQITAMNFETDQRAIRMRYAARKLGKHIAQHGGDRQVQMNRTAVNGLIVFCQR